MEAKHEDCPNIVAFYKKVHWSTKKKRFVYATAEHNYNKMVERLNDMEMNDNINEIEAAAFKEEVDIFFGVILYEVFPFWSNDAYRDEKTFEDNGDHLFSWIGGSHVVDAAARLVELYICYLKLVVRNSL